MKIEENASLLPFNTFGIDARCRELVLLDGCMDAAMYCDKVTYGKEEAPLVVGRGSNIVFTKDIDRTVVVMIGQEIRVCDYSSFVDVSVESGMLWSDFVDYCIDHGWHGLENLAGIPGTVGAAAVQNIGAYGAEAKDVIYRVETCDFRSADIWQYYEKDFQYGYRTSRFKTQFQQYPAIVLRVTFRLSKRFTPNLSYRGLSEALASKGITEPTARQVADTVVELRNSKLPDPRVVGSAGSFFKNPVVAESQRDALLKEYPSLVSFPVGEGRCKLAAGWLIEQCGWKGRSLGRAGVWEKQALVLVNRGGCTGEEVRTLAERIQHDVKSRFGVSLEPEAIIL